MDKIKEIYQHNGTDWGNAIPIGTDAKNVDVTDGNETTRLDVVLENIHNDILDSSDIGQKNADLIAVGLTNILTLNSSYFSGTAKYDKIGSMVIVYVNVTTLTSQNSNRRIESGAIPSGNRPGSAVSEVCRSYPSANLRVTTNGYVYLDYNDTTIPSGTEIKGEVAYFV